MVEFLWVPFLACLVLTAIHVYLGLHVLARGVLVVDQAPQGSEHIKQILVGSILTVTPAEVGRLALLYAPIGLIHWLARRPLLDISFDPDGAGARRAVRCWDFVFYASFGVVVTS